jgi:hypothetical protein
MFVKEFGKAMYKEKCQTWETFAKLPGIVLEC